MESQSLIGMAAAFIGLAIMLGLGTIILGGAITDCGPLDGSPASRASELGLANPDAAKNANDPSSYTSPPQDNTTTTGISEVTGDKNSWAYSCSVNSSQSQSAYGLLMVALVIMAAAVVLLVVRMLA